MRSLVCVKENLIGSPDDVTVRVALEPISYVLLLWLWLLHVMLLWWLSLYPPTPSPV